MIARVGEEEAKFLAGRFEGLKGYPKREPGQLELAKAILTAPNIKSAENFVTKWCREEKDCPKPKDIYDAFKSFRVHTDAPESTGCALCGGTGWRIVISPKTDHMGTSYTGANRCTCRPIKMAT